MDTYVKSALDKYNHAYVSGNRGLVINNSQQMASLYSITISLTTGYMTDATIKSLADSVIKEIRSSTGHLVESYRTSLVPRSRIFCLPWAPGKDYTFTLHLLAYAPIIA